MAEKGELKLPKHLGLILDGNRRWAQEQNLPAAKGYYQGAETLKTISLAAINAGVKHVSALVFSSDNWRRSKTELAYLMQLIIKLLDKYADEIAENEIRIVHAGARDGLPKEVLKAIDTAVRRTEDLKRGTLALCINYDGQQEIVDAARKLIRHGTDPVRLSVREFEQALYAPELPPIDLVIRTGGEYGTGGFQSWRAARAEYIFMDKNWPDFTKQDLRFALLYFVKKQGRHNKV